MEWCIRHARAFHLRHVKSEGRGALEGVCRLRLNIGSQSFRCQINADSTHYSSMCSSCVVRNPKTDSLAYRCGDKRQRTRTPQKSTSICLRDGNKCTPDTGERRETANLLSGDLHSPPTLLMLALLHITSSSVWPVFFSDKQMTPLTSHPQAFVAVRRETVSD